MAEAVVKFFLQKLGALLLQETQTISSVSDQIMLLKSKLEEIQYFLRNAERRKDCEEAVCNWVSELRDFVYEADDLIDKFIVQICSHDGLDPKSLIDSFGAQFEKIDAQSTEILQRKSQLNLTEIINDEGEDVEENSYYFVDVGGERIESCVEFTVRNLPYFLKSCLLRCFISPANDLSTKWGEAVESEGKVVEESSSYYVIDGGEKIASCSESTFTNLPYYLKSCFLYCCIFPDNHRRTKGRLVRLLTAEGLVQEREGKTAEAIAEENLRELIGKGMLRVTEKHPRRGSEFEVPDNFRELALLKIKEEMFISSSNSPDKQIPIGTRRLSIHGDGKNIPTNLNDFLIRSLFVFGIESIHGSSWESLKTAFQGVKLLKVLELGGVTIESLPVELGDLIHLRYLSLSISEITELPESLSNLRNLLTLDITWRSLVLATQTMSIVLSLARLRHLIVSKNCYKMGEKGVRMPLGIGKLRDLQTLTGIYSGDGIAEELNKLTQLRKLGVGDISKDHTNELFASIKSMENLISLTLESKTVVLRPIPKINDADALPLQTFSPPLLLQKLCLEGALENIPDCFGTMRNLTKLRLGFSHLTENPGTVLQCLPNLKILTLWHAYDGQIMGLEFCGVGGFPKLEDLSICSHVLEEWTELEEGAMPRLKYLHLHNCLKLRMLPEGLQHLSTLQQLDLLPLLDDHKQRLKPDGGEENYKIKHIPTVSFITTSMVQQLSESHPANARSQREHKSNTDGSV